MRTYISTRSDSKDQIKHLLWEKILELEPLEEVNQCLFFYLAVNKLIAGRTQKYFYFIVEHSGFSEFTLNQVDSIV